MLLAIDTAGDVCGLALAEAGELRAETHRVMARGHAEALLPMLGELLDSIGRAPADIDRVAVTVGPGSFTGLRVGIAAARGLALALGIPAEGYGGGEATAAAARGGHGALPVLTAIAGRGGEVVCQAFTATGEAIGAPERSPAAAAVGRFAGWQGLLAGSGAALLRSLDPGLPEPRDLSAGLAAALAVHASARPVEPARMPPQPFYSRPPDARPATAMPARASGDRG